MLAGIVEAGFLMAAADGELAPEEFDALTGVIVGFTDGTASAAEVAALLRACDEALASDGYDARISAVVQNLPTHALRRVALLCGAVVLGADDAFSEQHEGELYVALGIALGLSREEALDVLDEARQLYDEAHLRRSAGVPGCDRAAGDVSPGVLTPSPSPEIPERGADVAPTARAGVGLVARAGVVGVGIAPTARAGIGLAARGGVGLTARAGVGLAERAGVGLAVPLTEEDDSSPALGLPPSPVFPERGWG